MRELNRLEITLVSGADGEEEAPEANEVCSALGDAATAAAMAAVLRSQPWDVASNAAAATLAGIVANGAVSSGCQELSDQMYAYISGLIQEFEDSAFDSLNVHWY